MTAQLAEDFRKLGRVADQRQARELEHTEQQVQRAVALTWWAAAEVVEARSLSDEDVDLIRTLARSRLDKRGMSNSKPGLWFKALEQIEQLMGGI